MPLDNPNDGFFSNMGMAMTPDMTERLLDQQILGQHPDAATVLGGMIGKTASNDYANNPQMIQAVKMKKLMNDVSVDAKAKGIDVSADPIGFSKLVAAHAINSGMPDVAQKALEKVQEQTIAQQKSANETTNAGANMLNADTTKEYKSALAESRAEAVSARAQLDLAHAQYLSEHNDTLKFMAALKGRDKTVTNAELKTLAPDQVKKDLEADDRYKDLNDSDKAAAAFEISLAAQRKYKAALKSDAEDFDAKDVLEAAKSEVAKKVQEQPGAVFGKYWTSKKFMAGGVPGGPASPTNTPGGADLTQFNADQQKWIAAAQKQNPGMSVDKIIEKGKKSNFQFAK